MRDARGEMNSLIDQNVLPDMFISLAYVSCACRSFDDTEANTQNPRILNTGNDKNIQDRKNHRD